MPPTSLVNLNLAIEADLRFFTGLIADTVSRLGGSRFEAARASVDLIQKLRHAGAGSGYPLPAALLLDDRQLLVEWGEGQFGAIVTLPIKPAPADVDALVNEIQSADQSLDPALLLERNRQMARHLEKTRLDMEREMSAMQKALVRRQEELKESVRQAETDALTSLLNRRAFDERLDHSFRRTVRQKDEHLSLVLLDLDYFKEINDKHGHPYGDEYLRRMAAVLRGAIRRDVDYAFRLGGDEFALLMFVDRVTACKKALQILESMNHQVSIGVCSIAGSNGIAHDVAAFVRRADEALYVAKRSGRGRVMSDACDHIGGSGCTALCACVQEAV